MFNFPIRAGSDSTPGSGKIQFVQTTQFFNRFWKTFQVFLFWRDQDVPKEFSTAQSTDSLDCSPFYTKRLPTLILPALHQYGFQDTMLSAAACVAYINIVMCFSMTTREVQTDNPLKESFFFFRFPFVDIFLVPVCGLRGLCAGTCLVVFRIEFG